jgi:hypothetical protein
MWFLKKKLQFRRRVCTSKVISMKLMLSSRQFHLMMGDIIWEWPGKNIASLGTLCAALHLEVCSVISVFLMATHPKCNVNHPGEDFKISTSIVDLDRIHLCFSWSLRRVWRYQRGNQNPYVEEEQTTQWPKEKSTKGQQRSTKHTYKNKAGVTRTPLKTGGELRCTGRVSSSCSTSDTRRVNLVTNPPLHRKDNTTVPY